MKRSPQLPDHLRGSAQAAGDEGDGDPGSGRGWRIAAWVLSLLAVASLAGTAWLLFAPSDPEPSTTGKVLACIQDRDFRKGKERTCPPRDAEHVDGLVGKDEDGTFRLTTMEGQTRELTVREPDRPYVDVAHAQSHAQLGQPVRVYTRTYEGEDVVVYMEDIALP